MEWPCGSVCYSGWRWCLCPELQQASGCASINAIPLSTWLGRTSGGFGWKSSQGPPTPSTVCLCSVHLFSSVTRQSQCLAAPDDAQSLPQPSLAMQLLCQPPQPCCPCPPHWHSLRGSMDQGHLCEHCGHPEPTLAAPQDTGMCFQRKCGSLRTSFHTPLHELHKPNRQTQRSTNKKTSSLWLTQTVRENCVVLQASCDQLCTEY